MSKPALSTILALVAAFAAFMTWLNHANSRLPVCVNASARQEWILTAEQVREPINLGPMVR